VAKKKVLNEDNNEKVKIKKQKKKLSANEKRKIIFKIAGWIMAIAMIFGSLLSIFGLLIYR